MAGRKKAKTRFAVPDLGMTVNRRPARVGDAIRSELAMLLLRKIKDPRVESITISAVEVTPDLRTAVIYFSCADAAAAKAEEGLLSAQGFIRSHLAKQLALRHMPTLVFKYDLTASRHQEMAKIFREIENERQSSE